MSGLPRALHVVVPCRDEADHLPDHLAAMSRAVARCARLLPGVAVDVTVVLDGCRDLSAEVVARHRRTRPWLRALEVERGRVGAVRADGVRQARRYAAAPDAETWLAHTDADSCVPEHWLLHHAAVAARGDDLWLGTVRPAVPAPVLQVWSSLHGLGEGHRHVHGANLGVRASAYDAVGGFAPLTSGEDVRLVESLLDRRVRVGADDLAPVRTSARLVGRAPAGFASFLRDRQLVGG
ncbi:glycosyltransferase family 2 protein [Nocardioides marmoraquaticus]